MPATKGELNSPRLEFPTEDQLQAAAQTFGMLSDPTRLRILWTLLHGEQTVNRLAELVGVQQPSASQHLAKLRMARLVRQRRSGGHVYYEVDRKQVRPLLRQALNEPKSVANNRASRRQASLRANRQGLDRGVAPALSGWTMNYGHALPVASSAGLAINTSAVLGSLAIGVLFLGPIHRLANSLTRWLERQPALARRVGRSWVSRSEERRVGKECRYRG